MQLTLSSNRNVPVSTELRVGGGAIKLPMGTSDLVTRSTPFTVGGGGGGKLWSYSVSSFYGPSCGGGGGGVRL